MESLLFAIISLLLILPIIYFIPFGFTKKGKIIILISAFIVFIIGLAARTVMSVWQTGIVLILLAIGVTYILATRFGNKLFEKNEYELGSENKVIKFELEDGIEEEMRSQVVHKEELILPTFEPSASLSIPEQTDENQLENTDFLDETIDERFELEEVSEVQNELNNEIVYEEIEDKKEVQISNNNNLDDLLKELELELETANQKSEEADEAVVETTVNNDNIDELEEIEVKDLYTYSQPELEEINIDSLQVANDHQEEELIDIADETNDEVMEVIEDTKIEEYSEDEIIPNNSPSDSEMKNELLEINENDVNLHNQEPEVIDIQEEKDVTKQLLFNSMVSQINLSKNQLSSTQYEKLIVDHLHPGMSDHDYYTFVSLLIDHYIETKQYEELSSLISKNMNRFKEYPVILQEINFLLEEYCKI
ncbi:hypothetical protein [Bacillus sp. REN16]|uniref:hypothetical protein n=1 Tax=Bacillus sp. REN16 TaxID=2887296 RepID=UPI001E4E9D51|nr:hypothetical protein [Bacillus sp. REN16]MCC3356555.1 hypothetical protein [Bacillus sp. REN16]